MIITIVGGTGLVGQGIFKELAQVVDYELHSLSRNGKSKDNLVEPVLYQSPNLIFVKVLANHRFHLD
ncbi:hypothetical protein ACI3RH_08070 [Lactococcus lactis]